MEHAKRLGLLKCRDINISIANLKKSGLGPVPIKCITTGEIFESKKSVCDKYNITAYQLDKSLKEHVNINGNMFEIIKEDD